MTFPSPATLIIYSPTAFWSYFIYLLSYFTFILFIVSIFTYNYYLYKLAFSSLLIYLLRWCIILPRLVSNCGLKRSSCLSLTGNWGYRHKPTMLGLFYIQNVLRTNVWTLPSSSTSHYVLSIKTLHLSTKLDHIILWFIWDSFFRLLLD